MLFQTKQFVVYPKVLDDYMKRTFPQLKNSHIRFNDPALARGYESVPPEILLSSNNPSLRLSIFLYFLGLRVNHQNPRLTEQLWIIARDSSPYWSYFHIELASLARYELHDTQKAQEYLDYCLKYKSASAYCSSMTAETVGTVGSLEDAIRVSISL